MRNAGTRRQKDWAVPNTSWKWIRWVILLS